MPFFIRQAGRHVSGPFDTGSIKEWIRDGRVSAEMEFSHDRREWTPGPEVSKLFPAAPKRAAPRRRPRR